MNIEQERELLLNFRNTVSSDTGWEEIFHDDFILERYSYQWYSEEAAGTFAVHGTVGHEDWHLFWSPDNGTGRIPRFLGRHNTLVSAIAEAYVWSVFLAWEKERGTQPKGP